MFTQILTRNINNAILTHFYYALFFATYENYNNQFANIFIIIIVNTIFIYILILITQPRNIYLRSKHESTEVIRKKRNNQRKVTHELVRGCDEIRTTETAFISLQVAHVATSQSFTCFAVIF
jgi:hypothetical protein